MNTIELFSIDNVLNTLGYRKIEEREDKILYRHPENRKKWTINPRNKYRDTLKSILLIELA